ncbi:MAG: MarR family transcriptional regulator [Hyphomicrobiales bacterium]|nr:MarR family transcriptional regulator [Hyphomicrobiales bacterium]
MKDLDRKIGFLFHDVARFRTIVFDQLMQPQGLTRAQWWVLAHLGRKDGQTQTDLADRMDLGAVTLSGLIDRLEAHGWVERRPDPKDRRAKRVWLTDKVADLQKTMSRRINEVNKTSMTGLDDEQIEQLIKMLRIIKMNLARAARAHTGDGDDDGNGNGNGNGRRRDRDGTA